MDEKDVLKEEKPKYDLRRSTRSNSASQSPPVSPSKGPQKILRTRNSSSNSSNSKSNSLDEKEKETAEKTANNANTGRITRSRSRVHGDAPKETEEKDVGATTIKGNSNEVPKIAKRLTRSHSRDPDDSLVNETTSKSRSKVQDSTLKENEKNDAKKSNEMPKVAKRITRSQSRDQDEDVNEIAPNNTKKATSEIKELSVQLTRTKVDDEQEEASEKLNIVLPPITEIEEEEGLKETAISNDEHEKMKINGEQENTKEDETDLFKPSPKTYGRKKSLLANNENTNTRENNDKKENVAENSNMEDDDEKENKSNNKNVSLLKDEKEEQRIKEQSEERMDIDSKIDQLLQNASGGSSDESSDDDRNSCLTELIDPMAEEGEEDTPSEGSNDIVEVGEEINTTESELDPDDSYDKNSFIDDDDHHELLSGNEFDISIEEVKKRRRLMELSSGSDDEIVRIKKKEKKVTNVQRRRSRIIQIADSSEDENEAETEFDDSEKNEIITERVDGENAIDENSVNSGDDEDVGVEIGSEECEQVRKQEDSINDKRDESTDQEKKIIIIENILLNPSENQESDLKLDTKKKTQTDDLILPNEIFKVQDSKNDRNERRKRKKKKKKKKKREIGFNEECVQLEETGTDFQEIEETTQKTTISEFIEEGEEIIEAEIEETQEEVTLLDNRKRKRVSGLESEEQGARRKKKKNNIPDEILPSNIDFTKFKRKEKKKPLLDWSSKLGNLKPDVPISEDEWIKCSKSGQSSPFKFHVKDFKNTMLFNNKAVQRIDTKLMLKKKNF